MSDTLDSVPGIWTLWMRTSNQTTAKTFRATFTSSGPNSGQVILGSGQPSGIWNETNVPGAENLSFTIPDPEGTGETYTFSGFMVGLAAGGQIGPESAPVGAWSGVKISDPL
jgi:hypothetical protein